jgi:hypothetical protein
MAAMVPVGNPDVPVVPGYTLETRLGRGGSGEVWRAVPRRGGAPVAIKVLVAGDPERQAREAALLGERVEVGIRSGGSVMTISTAAPDSELRAAGWVGRTAPLSCTATGRALLFDLDTAAIARVIVPEGLGPAGPAAPRSLDELVSRVADERRRGWSAARHETDRGLLSLGAPVRDSGGTVVAALGVSGPESRIDPVLDEIRAAVLRAAGDLSRALGAGLAGRRTSTAPRAGPPPPSHHDGVSPLPPPPAPERGAS